MCVCELILWRSWCGVAAAVVRRAWRFPGLRGTKSKTGISGQVRSSRNTYTHLIISKAPRHGRRTKSRVTRSRWCHDSQTSINALTPTLTLSNYLVKKVLNIRQCIHIIISSLFIFCFFFLATTYTAIVKPPDMYKELRGCNRSNEGT